jgi:hypothetical protein
MFILVFNLVLYVLKISIWSLMFILSSNLIFPSVLSHVVDGLHTWTDTWTLGHVSKLNSVNDKTDRNDQPMQTWKHKGPN